MNTFLPLPDFVASAKSLDYRRLGKQRVEAMQIVHALQRKTGGWTNHPAVKMWRGYEQALMVYHDICILEWVSRGYRNTMRLMSAPRVHDTYAFVPPPWFGDEAFHASHRSNLLRKDPSWYGQFGWAEPPTLPYVWPAAPPLA